MGDYSAQVTGTNMASFYETYELKSLIYAACYKNSLNPSCIDLFLTNNAISFQKTFVMETRPPDFHRLWWSFQIYNGEVLHPKTETKHNSLKKAQTFW